MSGKPRVHEAGTRTGWLYNLYVTTVACDGSQIEREVGGQKQDPEGGGSSATEEASAIRLLLRDLDGDVFECSLQFQPYFLVATVEGHEHEVELGISSVFAAHGLTSVKQIEKEDLGMVNHLSGKQRTYLKLTFLNTNALVAARSRMESAVRRFQSIGDENPLSGMGGGTGGSGIHFGSDGLFGFQAETDADHYASIAASGGGADKNAPSWMSWVCDLREYDMKYHVRVAIDMGVYVGLWYDVTAEHGKVYVERCDDSKYPPTMPKICAFDIETTKAPLKFPQPEVDQIYMISYMLDTRGFLIVNREIVTDDIAPFEYTPKPEYEGHFETFNEPDEKALLRRFYDEMKIHQPNVYVTYNGDYFDFPFIHARSVFHGLNMRNELGFSQGAEGATLNKEIPHLDCFYWVKRDSYLPQGSQGLKAVTKYKLGYEPIEVDPEDMLPLAQTHPQRMASYSVSDAVSTYYLYMKYVHPFIYSLCTIIPMPPDEVLRKGSGTLCESLLCVQAYAKNVVFPNKQVEVKERFHDGHLIDMETYIGGRVEALKSGVFRSDIPIDFDMTPEVFTMLIEKLDEMLKFAIEVENKTSMSEITNYDEIKSQIVTALESLRSRPKRSEGPLIYHLDVGAMYPNIILTNRLQPVSMVTPEICAGCCFYTPDDQNNCRRDMTWVWRGEMFTAGRHEFARVKAQLESESFAATAVAKIDQGATTKKNYGNRKGNVLEGTAYEKKERDWTKKSDNAAGNGYRKMNDRQKKEAEDALLDQPAGGGGGSDESAEEDEDGNKKFHRLGENTQFNLLKKRVGEYSRKAYGKTHLTKEMYKTDTVCQRENTFFVDTVRLFRDRRYHYKAELKRWKGFLDKATTPAEVKEGKSRCVQMESLQLAHKCILNSFYGYVMRKGSRWYSMEMAGIVTYLGATLIKMARALVQQLGVTLELDTDGIWCCLPKSFPDEFTFTTANPKKNVKISYPCVMLNKDVQDRYTNAQYQDADPVNPGSYIQHDECSIYFEVDGPYLSMILPASKEEGKTIKKRYAVFNPNGKLAELKGFELKRRGELMLIKDFQSLVFTRFLDGTSLEEAYKSAAEVANNSLDLLYNKGEGYDDEEVMEKLTESSNMSRRLAEYPESQKSLALTTARRIAEFLGPQMVKDKGLACKFVISRTPVGKSVTDRAIPLNIFKADPTIRIHFLRKWLGDSSLPIDVGLKAILDWEYYIGRFQGTVQKIICIPAAFQGIVNPVPRVKHPEWLAKRIAVQNSKFKQVSLASMLGPKVSSSLKDLEDFGGTTSKKVKASARVNIIDSDDDNEQEEAMAGAACDEEYDERAAEALREEKEREAEEKEANRAFSRKYFAAHSATPMDNAFFTDRRFGTWLSKSKQAWTHRARLRKEIIEGSGSNLEEGGGGGQLVPTTARGRGAVGGTMDTMLIDAHAKALSTTWSILEVRAVPGVEHQVTIFALLGGSLQRFVVDVTRTVIVDMISSAQPLPNSRELLGKTLPRQKEAGRLYEVTLPQKGQRDALDKLLYTREDIRGVYEDHIDNATRSVLHCGAMCSVISQLHLSRRHKRGEFALDELEGSISSAKYWGKMPATAFVFHVTSPDGMSGVIGVLFRPSNAAVVCVVQSGASQRPTFNWKSLVTSAIEAVEGDATNDITLDVRVEFPTDRRAAFGILNRAIGEASESATHAWRPSLAVVQSSLSVEDIASSHGIPALQNLPIIRTAGSEEDLAVIAANPLTWQRPLARRMLLRFFAAFSWIEERAAVASVMNVPLCNLDNDINSSAMDFAFMRSLRRHSHVLWNPIREGYCYESVEERPKEVVTSGSHHVWATEFSISQAEVVAVLFSQLVQEGDDPRAHILCDGGVTSHFHVLRDLLSELYSQATQRREAAASLLLSFPRWLHDTVSRCYEPNIVVLVSRLVHRALTALLVRITKLGGRIARATTDTVVVVSSKHSLQDASGFANFLTSSLKDHPMLNHLNLRPHRYWCPLLLLDHMDYAGFYIAAEQAPALSQLRPSELPSPGLMTFEYSCTVWSRLPQPLREQLVNRLKEYCTITAMVKRTAVDIVDKDVTATLASKGEKLSDVFTSKMTTELDERWQLSIIDDVNNIVVQRVQLVENSFPLIRGTSDTGAAVEYAKVLVTMLSLGSTLSPSLWKIKNNCLRLCNISPFAPAASFDPDKRERATYIRTYCGFCSEQVLLHVGVGTTPSDWKCSGCASPFQFGAVEGHFLTEINRVVRRYLQQDFICVKCKQPAVSRVNKSVCCSTLVPRIKDSAWVLDTFQFIGDLHQMAQLLSAVAAARYMIVT